MKKLLSTFAIAAVAAQGFATPLWADRDSDHKVAAALAILGIAALAHNQHHYKDGYTPANGEETAEFERGYRDGVHGYPYWEGNKTPSYAQGYQAGNTERENSMAHRKHAANSQAPYMANKGCAERVAGNFDVRVGQVHIIKARSPGKHEWEIEAAVGHQHMVCKMRDTGELLDLRGGKM